MVIEFDCFKNNNYNQQELQNSIKNTIIWQNDMEMIIWIFMNLAIITLYKKVFTSNYRRHYKIDIRYDFDSKSFNDYSLSF